jgi:hypothetical protein
MQASIYASSYEMVATAPMGGPTAPRLPGGHSTLVFVDTTVAARALAPPLPQAVAVDLHQNNRVVIVVDAVAV